MITKQPLLLSAIVLLIGFAQQANAKIWRVNNLSDYNGSSLYGGNFGGTSLNPVFKQLSEAAGSSSVLAGDTLHLEGSPTVYNNITLEKKLIIIGAGYFLNQNPNSSANLLPSEIGAVDFNPGSEGSQLIGATITGDDIRVLTSNITIKRCRILDGIVLVYNTADIVIIGNIFEGSSSNSAISIGSAGAPANVIVNNNIFQKIVDITNGDDDIITLIECKNNVFDCPIVANKPSLRFNCAIFENNILKTPGAAVNINNNTNLNVSYNFSASASRQFGTANNNQVVDMTSLFVDQTTVTPDNKYKLKPGSAAGSDGTERGAFGGAAIINRYTLSGLAPIPVIYEIITSGVADATGLPVTIKARTIK